MSQLTFGRLREAWRGEASDFTPLLAEQLGQLGDAIGVDLMGVGQTEVPTTGNRRIDIVADVEGSEFVIENQYGAGDHDHLTRGLAYAVAREARGLVVVAEEHRDEFRAVADYLNGLAEREPEHSVAVWLVEARAVRIGDSPWAPLFTAVVAPNEFTMKVEQEKSTTRPASLEELLARCPEDLRPLLTDISTRWEARGHKVQPFTTSIALMASGPAKSGRRVAINLGIDGSVSVPFGSYQGSNSTFAVPALTSHDFATHAAQVFGFDRTEGWPRTQAEWLTPDRVDEVLAFALEVAEAYAAELENSTD